MSLLALAQAASASATTAATHKDQALFFWFFAAIAVAGALLMITRRSAVAAVMSLVATIVSLAAMFVMLSAGFLAAIQVIVYAGAIMVLFVFVIMIMNRDEEQPWVARGILVKGLAGVGIVYLAARVGTVLWEVPKRLPEQPWAPAAQAAYGTTAAVGRELFTSYLFPFEAISLVLLIAVIGALVLGGRRAATGEEEGVEAGAGTVGAPQGPAAAATRVAGGGQS